MSKRGNGEGSLYKRADGTWAGALLLPSGKRKVVYGKTQKAAREKLAQLRREAEAGLHDTVQANQTLGGFAAQWLDVKRHTARSKTLEGYEYHATHHLGELARMPLNKITPARLKQHYAERLQQYSPTTVHHTHAFIHVVLAEAVELGILPNNPADRVKAPPIKTEPITPLTWEQAQTLVQGVRGMRDEVGYLLALSCGMRSAEVRGVRWQDISLELRRVKVITTLKRPKGVYALEETKSRSSRRVLPLPGYLVETLRAHRARQEADRAYMGAAWQNPWGLVLTTEAGEPVNEGSFLHTFQKRCAAIGLPRETTVHDLRHTFATLLLERGVHIKVVSELLGHSSVELTLRVYGHVTPRMEAGAITEMNALLPDIAGYQYEV